MKAIDGIEGGCAFAPGEGWSTKCADIFQTHLIQNGFIPRPEPRYLWSTEALKYSRGGVIVAGDGGSPSLIQAWRLYEGAFVASAAPQLTSITVASVVDHPLSLVTDSGTLDAAFTDPIPAWVMELGVTIRDEINSEWFLSPSRQQVYILRRRFFISSEGIIERLHQVRAHLPFFPPGLAAELPLGAPVAAVSRCTSPRQTPAIERLSSEQTTLLWSNVRVTLVDQVISHKQLTHKSRVWSVETPSHLPSV